MKFKFILQPLHDSQNGSPNDYHFSIYSLHVHFVQRYLCNMQGTKFPLNPDKRLERCMLKRDVHVFRILYDSQNGPSTDY